MGPTRGREYLGALEIKKALDKVPEYYNHFEGLGEEEPEPEKLETEAEKEIVVVGKATPTWPQEIMTGAAGRFALKYSEYLETPQNFLFMNYLTILGHLISSNITLESALKPEPRLYMINLGESAETRKSTSINKTIDFFLEAVNKDDFNILYGAGSAEGLARAFNGSHRVLFVLDELKSLIQKMRIDASVLLPCINTLFESNHYHNVTKSHEIDIRIAELCLLAASTIETYRNMFTAQFLDIGFTNRLFVVIGESQRKFSIPFPIPEEAKEILRKELKEVLRFVKDLAKSGPYAMPLTAEAREIFDSWYHNLEKSLFWKRLDTYGHRLMPLIAVNEMKDIITGDIAEKVVTLLNYQLAARKYADPIDADNAVAKVEERIRRGLSRGPMRKRDLETSCHKTRVGTWIWDRAIQNLIGAKEIEEIPQGRTIIYRLIKE